VSKKIFGKSLRRLVGSTVDLHRPPAEVDVEVPPSSRYETDRLAPRSWDARLARETNGIDLGEAFGPTAEVADHQREESGMPRCSGARQRNS
jgi:hypothetical protein